MILNISAEEGFSNWPSRDLELLRVLSNVVDKAKNSSRKLYGATGSATDAQGRKNLLRFSNVGTYKNQVSFEQWLFLW